MCLKIKKAIIPAAGMGTRFLPVTKSVAKEMLPIVNVPTIQYIIEEAVQSGIEEILIIVSSNKNSIMDHFDYNYELENRLSQKNKLKEIELIKEIADKAKVYFIRQKEPLGLGHAISCAKTFIGNEPFAVLLGDDVVWNKNSEKPALKQCMEIYEKFNTSVLGVQEVAAEDICNYGVVKFSESASVPLNNFIKLSDVIEKPTINNAPSHFAILGRYILTPQIFDEIKMNNIGSGGEIQLTDAIKLLMKKQDVYACIFVGKRYDIGSKIGFLIANIEYGLRDNSLSAQLKEFLIKTVKDINC